MIATITRMAWDLITQLAHVSGQQKLAMRDRRLMMRMWPLLLLRVENLHPDASAGGNGGLEFEEDLCPDLNIAFKLSQRLVFFFTVLWG